MNLKSPTVGVSLGAVAQTGAALLALILLMALSVAPPAISLGDMEKRIVADRDEYYLGETVNITFLIVNPMDREARLLPVTEFTYGATMNGESWANTAVQLDYPFGYIMVVPAGGNHTLLRVPLIPTEPGELAVHAFGEILSVTVHAYMDVSLNSPGVYLNISAPDEIKAGEGFTAVFGIVNDNPYAVRLPEHSAYALWYGFEGEGMLGEVVNIEWGPEAYIAIEPRSQYVYKMKPFSPSRLSEYTLIFEVDGHEAIHTVRIEP